MTKVFTLETATGSGRLSVESGIRASYTCQLSNSFVSRQTGRDVLAQTHAFLSFISLRADESEAPITVGRTPDSPRDVGQAKETRTTRKTFALAGSSIKNAGVLHRFGCLIH